jgi:hypothetical protein
LAQPTGAKEIAPKVQPSQELEDWSDASQRYL